MIPMSGPMSEMIARGAPEASAFVLSQGHIVKSEFDGSWRTNGIGVLTAEECRWAGLVPGAGNHSNRKRTV